MKEKIFFVGITSVYPDIEIIDKEVSTSLVSIAFDKEKLEEIRRSRNISVNSITKKIGISRSRYYRWLDNEIDLPYNLLIGIQKILVLTDLEMHELFSQPTDEIIQKTSLLAFYSLNLCRNICYELRDSLQKHRNTTMKNDPYSLLIKFSELCALYTDVQDISLYSDKFTDVMDIIFIRDEWTIVDIIMLITMAYMVPKRFSKFLPELYASICQPSIIVSLNQKIFFLYDILCIAVRLKNRELTWKILKKMTVLDSQVTDWKAKNICLLCHTLMKHWSDKKPVHTEFDNILDMTLSFESVTYEQKMFELIKSYANLS
ncbi:helix-turn-helix domain-containing protein [Leuconostoc suionicum]|uniref:helix-turn-helix domain-containing protein n=1 Tax=Leuconostoc suionicum TaxID=1511761 RepID=UPI001B8AD112|nr:helix-turn-helix transcriptional regulator [Leuconostoc suionicum]MBS1008889.1 helix-turn-helix transcriptional regulator [Leuconostoc suionicum]